MVSISGTIAAVGAVAGAGISAAGSSAAAGRQSAAGQQSAAQQLAQWQVGYNALYPYRHLGEQAADTLYNDLIDYWHTPSSGYFQTAANVLDREIPASAPGPMGQAELEATPGYQFALNQGLKATQSSAAARGLGISGAALKGAAQFATGLADQTYQNQFNNQMTLYNAALNRAMQRYQGFYNLGTQDNSWLDSRIKNMLQGAAIGENAAAGTGSQAVQSGANIGNALQMAGTAQASGISGAAGSIGQGISNAANTYYQNQILQNVLGTRPGAGGDFSSTSAYSGPISAERFLGF